MGDEEDGNTETPLISTADWAENPAGHDNPGELWTSMRLKLNTSCFELGIKITWNNVSELSSCQQIGVGQYQAVG